MFTAMKAFSTQLIVIGGGATGLGIAWDASLRGIKTVLVDNSDLAKRSRQPLGLLHSGARYVLSDLEAASHCAKENLILRSIVAPALEDSGGFFVSTPADPLDYPDTWQAACLENEIHCVEVPTSRLLQREPLLNPRISRAFEVMDAALNPSTLIPLLLQGVQQAGGMILRRHNVTGFVISQDRIQSIKVLDVQRNRKLRIEADFVINAAGPTAGLVASMAGSRIPLALSKSTMLAMASRLSNSVINRCRPLADGDLIVPQRTGCVLGTTEINVDLPKNYQSEVAELNLLLSEADVLIPGIFQHRALRAWSDVTPLYAPSEEGAQSAHDLPRSHYIFDHRESDNIQNILTVIGGNLSTYRLAAQEALDRAANRLGNLTPAATQTTSLPCDEMAYKGYFVLPQRLTKLVSDQAPDKDPILCDCELLTCSDLKAYLFSQNNHLLDDAHFEFHLEMGQCQGAYCTYRVVGYADELHATVSATYHTELIAERWSAIRPLMWGRSLRQIELMRRVNQDLLRFPEIQA